MLRLSYQGLPFAEVKNVTGFFKDETHKNALKVKSIYDNIKILFGLNTLTMLIAEGVDVYKYVIRSQDHRKTPLGEIIYIPDERRLDIWDGGMYPLVQFKGKVIAHKGYTALLDMAKLDRLFEKLTNLL